MFATFTTPEPHRALKARKAISYPFGILIGYLAQGLSSRNGQKPITQENKMKTRLWIAALATLGMNAATQADLLFQSDFTAPDANLTNTGFVKSAGAAGGIYWEINTTTDSLEGVGGGNSRANVSTIGSWGLPSGDIGLQLDVTFRQNESDTVRLDFGLVDAAWTVSASSAWLSQSSVGAYGIGFSTTANGGADGLHFNNDAGTLTTLSTAQGDVSIGDLQTISIQVTATTWSYTLNGGPATEGTHTFDISRDYRFTAHAQNTGDLDFTNITLTSIPEPATLGMLGLGTALLLFIRRRLT